MPDVYNIAAQRGRTVGQGLMGMGQVVSGAMETQRKEKERKAENQFTKTLSLVNLYTKMGDDLTPEDRMKLYTGALVPMLAKAGGLPEGIKQEDVSQFIGSLAAHSKEAIQGFREDNNELLDLVSEGKWKEADKFLTGMISEYSTLPGAKTFLDHAKTMLKEEKEYSREKKGKEGERGEEVKDTIAGWLAEGKVEEVPEGGLMAGKKGTTFQYGGKQFFRPEEEKEPSFKEKETFKTEEAIRKAKTLKEGELGFKEKEQFKTEEAIRQAKALEKSKPEVKESTAIKELEAIKKGIDRYKTTGGLSDTLLAVISSSDPTFAQDIKKMPHDEAIEFMEKRYNYLFDNFVSQKNKSKYGLERFEEKAPVSTSNITHRFMPGKGLVPVQ